MAGLLFPHSGSAAGTDFSIERAKAASSKPPASEPIVALFGHCRAVGQGDEHVPMHKPGEVITTLTAPFHSNKK
jgi:hypothetical protein